MHLSSVVERVSVLIPVVALKELSIVVKKAWLMFHWHCPRILPKCKNSHLSSCHYRMHVFLSLFSFILFFITTNNKKTHRRLEQNYITEIPPKAFANHRRLRRIDLSNNNISRIAYDAFSGLKSLNSLVLYGNKIKELPAGVFKGLSSLQLLLLNANEISCIRKDSFRDLTSLSLLSLYDNNIQSLTNGTFDALKQIQTL